MNLPLFLIIIIALIIIFLILYNGLRILLSVEKEKGMVNYEFKVTMLKIAIFKREGTKGIIESIKGSNEDKETEDEGSKSQKKGKKEKEEEEEAVPDYPVTIFVSKEGDGFAHRIVIGEDGYPTCEYMDANGNITPGDYDLVPALESFIREHPDFSYHGARAILGFTGYEGVLGYRTKPSYEAALGSEAYAKEVADAKALAQCLRDKGWIIASHSYGHLSYGSEWKDGQNQPVSAYRVEADSDRWENTVQPIIGNCDIILYPNGSDIAGIEKYTFDNAKFKTLYEDGYRYFYNVDSHVAWQQLGEDYFRGGRRNLDGYRMWHTPKKLQDLFDVAEVFDPDRPTPVPSL